MNRVRDMLNSDCSGKYDAHDCTQDPSTISLSTFRYTVSPTYVAEAYANFRSVCDLEEMLGCAPPVTELHLIGVSVPGSRELRKGWKYQFLEQLKYPPVHAPHPSLNPPSHRLRLRKLEVIQFSPEWLHRVLEQHLNSTPRSVHWYRLGFMMRAHVASFPGHVARKFVVPLCRTLGPYDKIIRTIALWAAEHCGVEEGSVQRDHERFGFVNGMWRLELETKLSVPRYYVQPGLSLDALL